MSAPLAPAPVPAGDLTSGASPAATDPRRSTLQLTVVRTPGPPAVQPRGPVALVLPGRYPDRPAPPPGPRPRMDAPAQFPGVDPEFGPRHTRRTELPEATGAGRRLVTLALEAFAGRRPIAQLRPVVTPALFAALSSGRRPRWCAEGTAAPAVTSVRVCEPVDGVAEVSAVVRLGGRAHAVAARLEGIDGRWRCTALQVG